MTIDALPLMTGITTGSDQVFTVPVNTTWVVKKWAFNNATSGAVTVTVTVNIGGALEMLSVAPIAANTLFNPVELNGLTLTAGDTVTINGDAGIAFVHSGLAII